MGWVEKARPTPFDDQPIEGVYFLDGDQVARVVERDWSEGYKYPLIVFPSGEERPLWASASPEHLAIVHVFGELDLPLADTRDKAYAQACDIAEQCGYLVRRVGEDQIEAKGHDTSEHVIITYDDEARRMVDVEVVKDNAPPPRMPLLDEKSRESLPELYSGEEAGLEALAQVKFFAPWSHWTWYASEYDGEDIFFGMVAGDFIELGYFSLSELEGVQGPMGLRIERDRHFEPATLLELRIMHENVSR